MVTRVCWFVGEVDSGEQMPKEATCENSDRNVWCMDHITDPHQSTGLGSREPESAGTIGNHAAPAARRTVRVAASRIRLPGLNDSVRHPVTVSVEHPTLNGQLFAGRLDCDVDGSHANREEWSNGLRGCRVKSHVTPPSVSPRARAARC